MLQSLRITVTLLLLSSCFGPTRQAAPCETNADCTQAAGGACIPAPTGIMACAYPSPGCASGLAWSDLQPSLGGACTDVDAGADAPTDAPPGPIVESYALADLVVGQSGFTTAEVRGVTASSITGTDVAAGAGGVWVSDNEHNRVLYFSPPPSVGDPAATLAIGRPSLTDSAPLGAPSASNLDGTGGIAVVAGKLIISDHYRHRVLVWNRIPTASGAPADLVLGQSGMTTASAGAGANQLRFPAGVWSDGTRLVVADSGNHRVLIWSTFPSVNGAPADHVLGQSAFGLADNPTSPSASTMRSPWSVTSDGTRLFVGDFDFRRVLMWSTFPAANNAPADVAIGQPTLTSADMVSASPSYLMSPTALTIAGDALFVTDRGNWRVAVWQPIPSSSGASATLVLGQPDLSSNTQTPVPSQQRFRGPAGLSVSGGKLFVGDDLGRRVLRFALR